ncbi:MAG: hypothetical protein GX430_05540 [Treponema sp.]|nr:hypothetical protein [Treponema sp.]
MSVLDRGRRGTGLRLDSGFGVAIRWKEILEIRVKNRGILRGEGREG